ncbi:putative copper resistance protein D [Sphingomonas sp. UYAg733]
MDVGLLLIAARWIVYAALLSAFGVSLFGVQSAHRLQSGAGAFAMPGPLLAGLAAAGFVASIAQIVAMAAAMAGIGIGDIDLQTLLDLVLGTAVGYAWLTRVAALLCLALAGGLLYNRPSAMLAVALGASGIATATLAWTGHGAMDDGARGWVHLGADMLHLLAAGGWLGAIAALILLLRPSMAAMPSGVAQAHRALERFSTMGAMFVGVVLATGIVNTWLIIGPENFVKLPTVLYGQLLIAKVALFATMLTLAAANRFRLVPALAKVIATGDNRAALHAMRRSLLLELGCAIVILALVAWLGTLEPLAVTPL